MATETELRHQLKHARPGVPAIDVTAVIRRSRRRRLANQLVVGGTTSLAVVGIFVAAVTGIGGSAVTSAGGSSETAADSDSSGREAPPAAGGSAATDALAQAPADKINLCEGAVAEVAPSPTGLEITPVFPATAPAGTGSIEGTVVMTNAGSARVIGTTTALPAMTLSQASTVLWHSNGFTTMAAVSVDLAPGESQEYPATFQPVRCSVEDDEAAAFRDGLPPLAPGTYTLSAAIDFVPGPATDPANRLITGQATSIVLQ